MRRSENRILTTHVGSLIRPPELEAQGAHEGPALKAAVADVVARQVRTGVDVVNDGEFGKLGWSRYFFDRVSGFELHAERRKPLDWLGRDRERFAEFFEQEMPEALDGAPSEVCVGPIDWHGDASVRRDITNLQAAADAAGPVELFMTCVAPGSAAYNGVNEYYGSEKEYVFALAEALRNEYRAVAAAGIVLQVDDALLANMFDYLTRDDPKRYRDWARLRIDALNHALEGIPLEQIRYHVCFGSWQVPHVADAPLEEIIDLVLEVNAGAYALEAANPRHEHEWRVWEKRRLPEGRILIPGVVTHHTTTVEHPRLVADRIVRYAKLLGRENVIAGTDCGFAQTKGIKRVHESVMWAKLESLVEGARIASAELWGRGGGTSAGD